MALVQFTTPDDTLELGGGIEAMATSLDALHLLETTVQAAGVPVFARSRTTDDPGQLLGVLADESVADLVLVPSDPSYVPPGGTQAPAAPTARLAVPDGHTIDGTVVAHFGTDSDRTVLELGLRLARARGQALAVEGNPGRRLASTVEALRAAGLVSDDGRQVGMEIRGGVPGRVPSASATVWVQIGRDDGVSRLADLIDRLRTSPTTRG